MIIYDLIHAKYTSLTTCRHQKRRPMVQKKNQQNMILRSAMENFPNNKNIQEYGQTIIESFDLSDFFMKEE